MRARTPTPRMAHWQAHGASPLCLARSRQGNADLRSARAGRRPAHDASPLCLTRRRHGNADLRSASRGPKASARRIAALPHETQARERRHPVGTRGPKASARRIAALPHETQARERRPPVGTRGPKASARRIAALPHETQARERRPPVGTRGPKASARRLAALPHETQARERRPPVGTRGSAKPAPMTRRPTSVSPAPSPHPGWRARHLVQRLIRKPVARVLLASAALAFAGCDADDTLPGRSRPTFEHDWPDPDDLASRAQPRSRRPMPGEALFEASSGVRAYIVPAAADPLVRLTAALPLGRLHEAEGEAGAAALLTHLLTTRGVCGGHAARSRYASPSWARR